MEVEPSTAVTHPLLAPFTDAQQAVVNVLKDVFLTTQQRYPVYGYVERELDKQGYALEQVLPTFPRLGGPGFADVPLYAAVWYDRIGGPDRPMGLTVAGLAHLPDENQYVVRAFLAALREIARFRAEDTPDPFEADDPKLSSVDLIEHLRRENDAWLKWLPNVFAHEPPLWGHQDSHDPAAGTWIWRCGRSTRHFVGVADVPDYLTRMSAYLEPKGASANRETFDPPIGFAAALDFLDTVWQLVYGARLVNLPSATVITSLAEDAHTAPDFDARLSALGQVLKGLVAKPVQGVPPHPVQWMGATLRKDLPSESQDRVNLAIDTLAATVHVRNAMQHTRAAAEAVAALATLGLTYPVTDWTTAWRTIRSRATAALWALREELQAKHESAEAV